MINTIIQPQTINHNVGINPIDITCIINYYSQFYNNNITLH